ncbi:thiamine transport system ATP-binding protein [Palleronia marisminoris]|uniref:Thiamine import ATP-binding protein ThiQ n=1 Tax=Palleronia marisminoris TaxID=315423 RepID=A0A1Y5TPZ5_9RHOB|nr:ATP-binding cassette domain-containing protein [Palleronia marisminoris]SFH44181.1 thiamine transport system ATP-binding protein [Palleronia marisminoris]SLN67263.1 Thiamine import ATP-binding protein ThiQ [Palleronia marisminoris]
MLTLEGLVIRQGEFVLRADLVVPAGAQVAVMGPSGAGKSTLLSVIGGFFDADEGRILWEGERIDTFAPGKRPVATIFQDNNLFPHMSAAENVALGIRPSGRLSRDERERVDEALVAVGLDGFEDRKPGSLSGGQQSRVAFARALLQERPLLLLDEPFAALGPAMRGEMQALVGDLARERGRTMLMVTHDPGDARRIGGETILVADGRAAAPMATDELLRDPPPALRDYLGS